LKLVLDVSFKPGFAGEKNLFLGTRNLSGEEAMFQPGGSWEVNSCTARDSIPSTVSAAPASGGGWGQTFTLTYASSDSSSDLADIRVLFNRVSDGISACYVTYDQATDTLGLADDASLKFTTIPLRSGRTIENSQCSASADGSSVSRKGSALVWKLAVKFKPAFAGRKNVYLYALGCNKKDTGMRKRGTWTVPYGSP
jgi:hypothetical protein